MAPATAKPGAAFAYDNTNYILLGLIIEKVTGRGLVEGLQRDLWSPAHLRRLAYQDAHVTVLGGAGAVAGDAESVARWGYELYGSRLLPAGSVAQMTDFSDGDGYGLGTWDFSARRERPVEHRRRRPHRRQPRLPVSHGGIP